MKKRDTPRTDAQVAIVQRGLGAVEMVEAGFARLLERELAKLAVKLGSYTLPPQVEAELTQLRAALAQEQARSAALERERDEARELELAGLVIREDLQRERDEARATVAALQQRLDEALAVLRQCHATFRAKCEGQHNWPKEQIEAIIWPHGAALAPDGSGATEGAKP